MPDKAGAVSKPPARRAAERLEGPPCQRHQMEHPHVVAADTIGPKPPKHVHRVVMHDRAVTVPRKLIRCARGGGFRPLQRGLQKPNVIQRHPTVTAEQNGTTIFVGHQCVASSSKGRCFGTSCRRERRIADGTIVVAVVAKVWRAPCRFHPSCNTVKRFRDTRRREAQTLQLVKVLRGGPVTSTKENKRPLLCLGISSLFLFGDEV